MKAAAAAAAVEAAAAVAAAEAAAAVAARRRPPSSRRAAELHCAAPRSSAARVRGRSRRIVLGEPRRAYRSERGRLGLRSEYGDFALAFRPQTGCAERAAREGDHDELESRPGGAAAVRRRYSGGGGGGGNRLVKLQLVKGAVSVRVCG